MEPLPVHFAPVPDGEKRKLTLDLQKEGKTANGWKILPVTLPTEVIYKQLVFLTLQFICILR